MTKKQIDLAHHALGHKKQVGYRNYYAADPDQEDDREWAKMVKDGTAVLSREPSPMFPCRIYSLTEKGKREAWEEAE